MEVFVLDLLEGFEVYEFKVVEEINLEFNVFIEGKKVFEYLLLFKVFGDYEFMFKFIYFLFDSVKYVIFVD